VLGVAGIAAVVSYEHASALVRAHGESGWTGRLIPLTAEGLIYASSMVMLDAARRGARVPALARWLLGLGIVATLAANITHGLRQGALGAVVGAWPAVALVGRPSWCSRLTSQRSAFPLFGRSVLSFTSASHGHSGCGTTSQQELKDGRRIRLRNQQAVRARQASAERPDDWWPSSWRMS
jgi:hypothetical protein